MASELAEQGVATNRQPVAALGRSAEKPSKIRTP